MIILKCFMLEDRRLKEAYHMNVPQACYMNFCKWKNLSQSRDNSKALLRCNPNTYLPNFVQFSLSYQSLLVSLDYESFNIWAFCDAVT